MAEYDPQRSRPRRRVTDESGPAPVDAMLDAKAGDDQPAPPRNGDRPPATAAPEAARTADTGDAPAPAGTTTVAGASTAAATEVVDLAPAPPVVVERSSRRARLLLVAVVVGLALLGFVLRRLGAARRARRLADD